MGPDYYAKICLRWWVGGLSSDPSDVESSNRSEIVIRRIGVSGVEGGDEVDNRNTMMTLP
jgi:hypothetical protein